MSAVSPSPRTGTDAFNPAFDVTPPELITAVVTENGPMGEPNTAVGQQIADIARSLYARGWMPGTAGNISVRNGSDGGRSPAAACPRAS